MEGVATDGIPGHIDPTATHLPNRVDPVGSLTMVDDVLHAEAANERSLLLASTIATGTAPAARASWMHAVRCRRPHR